MGEKTGFASSGSRRSLRFSALPGLGPAITPARVLRALTPPPLPSERSDLRARRTAGFALSRRRCDDGNSRGDGGTRQVTQPCSTHP